MTGWKEIERGFETTIKGCNILYFPIGEYIDIKIPGIKPYIRLWSQKTVGDVEKTELNASIREDTFNGFYEGEFWCTGVFIDLKTNPDMIDCNMDENDLIWMDAAETYIKNVSINEIIEWMIEDEFLEAEN